jgi:hypothetical protein
MAHFAELDSQNIVTRVLVVENSKITDEQGQEREQLGQDFLRGLFGLGTVWVQTSYNGNFRKNYATIGCTYDSVRDGFIPPMPDDGREWVLDEQTLQWVLAADQETTQG